MLIKYKQTGVNRGDLNITIALWRTDGTSRAAARSVNAKIVSAAPFASAAVQREDHMTTPRSAQVVEILLANARTASAVLAALVEFLSMSFVIRAKTSRSK